MNKNTENPAIEHVFAGENISVKTEAQRHRTKQNGNHFQQTDHHEYADHQHFEEAGRVALGTEQVQNESARPIRQGA